MSEFSLFFIRVKYEFLYFLDFESVKKREINSIVVNFQYNDLYGLG